MPDIFKMPAIKLTRSTDTWTHARKNALQFLASILNLFFFNPFYIWLMSALDVIDLSI